MSFRPVLFVIIGMTSLLASIDAFAGDYTVSYAFDRTTREDVTAGATSPFNEAGTTNECQYDRYCRIVLPKSDLTISLKVERSGYHKVVVLADGGRSRSIGCCFFSDGERRVERDVVEPLLRLRIFEGRARRRNEFVENLPLGLLYLQLSNLK